MTSGSPSMDLGMGNQPKISQSPTSMYMDFLCHASSAMFNAYLNKYIDIGCLFRFLITGVDDFPKGL